MEGAERCDERYSQLAGGCDARHTHHNIKPQREGADEWPSRFPKRAFHSVPVSGFLRDAIRHNETDPRRKMRGAPEMLEKQRRTMSFPTATVHSFEVPSVRKAVPAGEHWGIRVGLGPDDELFSAFPSATKKDSPAGGTAGPFSESMHALAAA